MAVLSEYFLVVYKSSKVTCSDPKEKVRMVRKMATSKTWSCLKNALNKTMHCIKDACWGAGRADTTPDARTSDAHAPPQPPRGDPRECTRTHAHALWPSRRHSATGTGNGDSGILRAPCSTLRHKLLHATRAYISLGVAREWGDAAEEGFLLAGLVSKP